MSSQNRRIHGNPCITRARFTVRPAVVHSISKSHNNRRAGAKTKPAPLVLDGFIVDLSLCHILYQHFRIGRKFSMIRSSMDQVAFGEALLDRKEEVANKMVEMLHLLASGATPDDANAERTTELSGATDGRTLKESALRFVARFSEYLISSGPCPRGGSPEASQRHTAPQPISTSGVATRLYPSLESNNWSYAVAREIVVESTSHPDDVSELSNDVVVSRDPLDELTGTCCGDTFRTIHFDTYNRRKPKMKRRVGNVSPVVKSPIELTMADVICGRGGHANTHPGNIAYRNHVKEILAQNDYVSLSRHDKTALSIEVVDWVHDHLDGRFVARDNNIGGRHWYVVDVKTARMKVSQFLRGHARHILDHSTRKR